MKNLRRIICAIAIISILVPSSVFARQGDNSYEGGISSGGTAGKNTFEYQEVCFLSGEPVVFKGTLTVKKSIKQDNTTKQDVITTTYTYSNLKNTDRSAAIARPAIIFTTRLTKTDSGQTVEETSLSKVPTEIIKIKNTTYTLKNYDFTRTSLIDAKPAINYYAGDIWSRKTYQVSSGTGSAAVAGQVTVEETGNIYGYDQYWGTTETQKLNYIIQCETPGDKWGGTASVNLSSTMVQQLSYEDNEPSQISFKGGYRQTQHNESVLEYSCKLPEFDAKGVSTDTVREKKSSLKLESSSDMKRLPVPNLSHIRGHWAEDDINIMYSLGVFKRNDAMFNPEQYLTRAEFAEAIVGAAREVPPDPALASKIKKPAATGKNSKVQVVSPFNDVSTDNIYFDAINTTNKRGLMGSANGSSFLPNSSMTLAEAVSVFIRALGLESMAPNPAPVTTFKDNDAIPAYARSAVYAAEQIGLVLGDSKGYLRPNDKLTKARAAVLLNRFIGYMRDGIRNDYGEGTINY